MRRIFSKLLYEIEEERNTMLVTVIADRGSAPRGAGAAMLVGEKGRITGTIGRRRRGISVGEKGDGASQSR